MALIEFYVAESCALDTTVPSVSNQGQTQSFSEHRERGPVRREPPFPLLSAGKGRTGGAMPHAYRLQ